MWLLLSTGSGADSGDTGVCDWAFEDGMLEDGVCVVRDVSGCCGDIDCWEYADVLERGGPRFDCANGSEVGHVYYWRTSGIDRLYWFDPDGEPLGIQISEGSCCEGRRVWTLRCGEAMGACLAPVLSEVADEVEPSPADCPAVTVSVRDSPEPRFGCSVGRPGGSIPGLLTLAAALLGRRRCWA